MDEFIRRARKKEFFPANAWVREPGFESLYVRFGQRYIGNVKLDAVLDIANATTIKKGKGTFTNLIHRLRKEYPDVTLYVECVINQFLQDKLLRLGFTKIPNGHPPEDMVPYSYSWIPGDKHDSPISISALQSNQDL